MNANKIIRSLCYFTQNPGQDTLQRLEHLSRKLQDKGFEIQTQRICTKNLSIRELDEIFNDDSLYLSVGCLTREEAKQQLGDFLAAKNVAFNLDLSNGILPDDVALLFDIIHRKPEKTFSFTYIFQNAASSPYFPSANYESNGFAVGLQPTDLSKGCSLNHWFLNMKAVWDEIVELFRDTSDFLGIDSSIAPLFTGKSSFIHFIKELKGDFESAVTTDVFLKITDFIEHNNPKPIGLCGIMLPCLEDFELADEYEQGHFSIERNIYLSLHSGLGIDTYPVGIDEDAARIFDILSLLMGFARKYHKPLSARFVSDGISKIGDKSSFKNQYLKDVVIRAL